MLYIPKIDDYFKILTDKEVKDILAILMNILNLQETNKILEKLLNRFIFFY